MITLRFVVGVVLLVTTIAMIVVVAITWILIGGWSGLLAWFVSAAPAAILSFTLGEVREKIRRERETGQ